MSTIRLTIDGQAVAIQAGATILQAARRAGIYIPTLCAHPDLPPPGDSRSVEAVYQGGRRIENRRPHAPGQGCGICLVAVEGLPDLMPACSTPAENGMTVATGSDRIRNQRRRNLIPVLSRHRHACLTCTQQAGCPRTQCSANVPENARCCPLFGNCELQEVVNYVGLAAGTPQWIPSDIPVRKNEPLFERDYNLCIGCTRCVRVCNDVRGVGALGFVFDAGSRLQVGTLAPDPVAAGCRFCLACVAVCPTGALRGKGSIAGKRNDDPVPCRTACPAHIDVPGYLRLMARGQTDEALAVILEKVALPGVLGRICTRPCEQVCRRGGLDDPLAICALKRFAADHGTLPPRPVSAPTGKRAAVIGAGPAGLTAAFHLRQKGHAVTVFEGRAQAGGMLRYGIPAFRLPRDVLDREIAALLATGIELKTNQRLGRDVTLGQLRHEGFDALFLAVGAQAGSRIAVEKCDRPDVLWAVEFLADVACGKPIHLKESVVVIGGGNVAVDAARTALRCGARKVSLACLESEAEMPAGAWEIAAAEAEGVTLLPACGLEKIIREAGRVIGLELVECVCVFDANGAVSPQFNPQNKICLPVDQIIVAAGQIPDLSFMTQDSPLSTARGLIVVDKATLETEMPGVWAGGDATQSPGTVIHAMAAGRKAAAAIDCYLGGDGCIDAVLLERTAPNPVLGRDEGFSNMRRIAVPEIGIDDRKGFAEIVTGYGPDQAMQEAGRCLQCDLRLTLTPNPRPPEPWLPFTEAAIQTVPQTEGVFQLLDPDRKVIAIQGTPTLRQELQARLSTATSAAFFTFEAHPLYSQRETELIQKHLQTHGQMPTEEDDDDLF